MSDASRLKCTIHVGGLDPSITRDLLHQAFLPFGEIVEIQLPLEDRSGTTGGAKDPNAPHRGFCLIEFESQADAAAAIDNMDQAMLAGRVLKVSQAKPQKEAYEGLGSKVAVWEQEGWLAKHEVSEEDRIAAQKAQAELNRRMNDPMQGLEGLDVAGPKKPEM
ncbi:putative peptidyl prolyl cis-trans isomerase cyclophilin [Kalaharituber pfeilii]|nr:putative peptidyl prolyl cis-trans isomerase cyclophilin [Kalaharituber pfeilii]